MSPRVFVLAVVILPSRRYPAHMLVASEADGTVAFLPHHPDLEVWAVPIDPATAPAPNTTAMRLTAFPVVMRSVKPDLDCPCLKSHTYNIEAQKKPKKKKQYFSPFFPWFLEFCGGPFS